MILEHQKKEIRVENKKKSINSANKAISKIDNRLEKEVAINEVEIIKIIKNNKENNYNIRDVVLAIP